MRARLVIPVAVGALALAIVSVAVAAPPQLGSPLEGASFTAGEGQINFQAQITSNANPTLMHFFITRNPSQVDANGVFSPWVDHIRGTPTGDPGVFEASADSDDAWPNKPDTYWWQAVQNCTGGDADCVNASPPRMLTITAPPPLPAAAVTSTTQIETFLDRHPRHRTRKRKVKFKFSSNVAGASFKCLFAKGWADCQSPHVFRRLKPGRYKFEARAVVNGLEDPSPASWTFRILRRNPN
jgi:hypothetical protein